MPSPLLSLCCGHMGYSWSPRALRASGRAPRDRVLSAPHPVPYSWYLRLRGCLSGSFWSPGLSLPQTLPTRDSSPISRVAGHTSAAGCVPITPGGPPGKREVEVAGMRENGLAPLP